MKSEETFAPQERARADEIIEHVFEFVRDIIEDPSPLANLPDEAELVLTPLEQAGSPTDYAATTKRFAVSVARTTNHQRTSPRTTSTSSPKRRSA